jgi:hypothetical protein
MRRSFAAISISNVQAAALGLIMPFMASVAVAAPIVPTNAESNAVSAPVNESAEGAADDVSVCVRSDDACVANSDAMKDRAYLVETAHPGDTMARQGPDVAIGRLNPEFTTRLAAAIREARGAGLSEAGIFSAYRPPAFGVGGFKDKFNSLHGYGLAVDMHGIGSAGSSQAKLWHQIAAKHGVVCPYGVDNRAEWNHCQPTRTKMVKSDSPLRKTIVAQGPVSRGGMFEAGRGLIESIANLFSSFGNGFPSANRDDRVAAYNPQRGRRIRTADAGSSRQHRQVRQQARLKGRKGEGTKVAHASSGRKVASATAARKEARSGKHATKHRTSSIASQAQQS